MKFNLQKMISGAVGIMKSALYKKIFGAVCMLLVVAVAVIYCGQMIEIAVNLKNPVSVNPTGMLKEDHVVIVDYEKSADSLSYEAIREEITAYFDNFYAQNKNFSVRSFTPDELTNTIGTWVNGYFYNEQLVWVQLATFGDLQERFSDYYIINSELVYLV